MSKEIMATDTKHDRGQWKQLSSTWENETALRRIRGHKSYSFDITLFLFNLQAQKLYGSVPEYTYLFAKKKKQTLFNVSIKIGIDIYTL